MLSPNEFSQSLKTSKSILFTLFCFVFLSCTTIKTAERPNSTSKNDSKKGNQTSSHKSLSRSQKSQSLKSDLSPHSDLSEISENRDNSPTGAKTTSTSTAAPSTAPSFFDQLLGGGGGSGGAEGIAQKGSPDGLGSAGGGTLPQPIHDALFAQPSSNRLMKETQNMNIGIVLPMTGKYANIAQKTLRGASMGLGLYDSVPSPFKLIVMDSEGNPDKARQGVDRLVNEYQVIALIGSVLSKTANSVASRANELGVPSIALSQKSGVTETGPFVFRNSITSEMQVKSLVHYAMKELGIKKFGILFPNDAYGVEFANLFWNEVLTMGGEIRAAQPYSNKETDFKFIIQRMVGTYYIEDREAEYKFRFKEWKDKQVHRTSRNVVPEGLLPPVVDFEALFIPDGIKTLGQVSAMLSYNDVKNIKLLGTNLWNVPGLEKRAGHFSKDLLFVDSFSLGDPSFIQSDFVAKYKEIFNETPGVFEIQAYDSARLIKELILNGVKDRNNLAQQLNQIQNAPGALGPQFMLPSREIQRSLMMLTLESGSIIPFSKPTKE